MRRRNSPPTSCQKSDRTRSTPLAFIAPVLTLLVGAGACSETKSDGNSSDITDNDNDVGTSAGGLDTQVEGSCAYVCREHCVSEGGTEHPGACEEASLKCCEVGGSSGGHSGGDSGGASPGGNSAGGNGGSMPERQRTATLM